MRKIACILFVIVGFACSRDGSRSVIKGEIENCSYPYIYFQELIPGKTSLIDSVPVDKQGSFKLKFNLKQCAFYMVWVRNQKPLTLIVHPGDKIKVSANSCNLLYSAKISDSEDSRRAQIISLMNDRTIGKLDSLNNVYHQFIDNPNIVQIKQTLTYNYDRVLDEQRAFTFMFFKQDEASLANIIALYQETDIQNHIYLLNREEDFVWFDKLDSLLYKKYPDVSHVILLHSKVNDQRVYYQRLKMERLLSFMGSQAPEIALPSLNGDTIRLSSLKGKYVLVDFWASWCPPCRAENPNLVALYKKYHFKGFEIYQVSLDKTRDAWIKAIQNDKLDWIQVSDLKFWNSPVVKTYSVESIPASFLIDKDGSIIGRSLQGESLEDRLRQIFGE